LLSLIRRYLYQTVLKLISYMYFLCMLQNKNVSHIQVFFHMIFFMFYQLFYQRPAYRYKYITTFKNFKLFKNLQQIDANDF
jgi:hypothetical protein